MKLAIAKALLGPLLLAQGHWVRRRTPVLPEPEGAREGIAGAGPKLRVLVVGDSAGAGVGAPSQEKALLGRIVAGLAGRFHVKYRLVAKTGATTASTLAHLAKIPAFHADAVVVSLGVNDVTGDVGPADFIARQRQLHRLLREKFGARYIVVSGLPPMGSFTALPQPLRWYLGARARELDLALAASLPDGHGAHYMPLFRGLDASLLASDGFHPGPPAHAKWGAAAADRIAKAFGKSDDDDCA
ncbi:MAG: SGNH/GDSL hydrolase family protein [Betaproteobacteria bacterium]|nr:SGNH/GDSL hydrolase family protein [Betaproteobacteria bacterium]